MIEVSTTRDVTTVKGIVEYNGIKLSVNIYLTDNMLIDTGPVSLIQEFIPFFQQAAFDFVVLTHFHEDHTGCAPWLGEHKQIPIYVHPTSITECRDVSDYPDFRRRFWGIRKGFTALPLEEEFCTNNFNWKVFHTPGHSYDHVVLLNTTTGTLFSGDLLVSPKPKGILADESIPQMINSIKLVLKLDFESMFCSHLGYVINGKELLQVKLDYLENLQTDIICLFEHGLAPTEINKRLFPKTHPLIAASNYQWNSLHIIQSVIKEAISKS